MTLDEVVSKLEKAKRKSHDGCIGWQACCPAHDDKNPSFMVWEKDGWLKFNCQTGCTEEAIMAALGIRSVQEKRTDYKHEAVKPEVKAVYDYTDPEAGTYLFSKLRIEPGKDGAKKDFRQGIRKAGAKKDDRTGYDWKISTLGDRRFQLYRYYELKQQLDKGAEIHVCEGEKAANLLWDKGIPATCQNMGADGENPASKWLPKYTDLLKGARSVIVWADREPVGEAYAKYVAAELANVCDMVRVVQSATTKEHDDAYDHFTAGKTADEAVYRKDLSPDDPLSSLTIFAMKEWEPVKLNFLWEPYLPSGKIVLAEGDGFVGKTSLAIGIAACLSNGITPITCEPRKLSKTIFIAHSEDAAEELNTVYRACEGTPEGIAYEQSGITFTDSGINKLRRMMRAGGFEFAIFDGLFDFLQGMKMDSNNAVDIVSVLGKLQRLALETNVTFWLSRHTGKEKTGKALSDLGLGSAMIRNKARGQLLLRKHKDQRAYRDVVVVQDLRGSILRKTGEPFAFKRVENAVEFVTSCDLSEYSDGGGDDAPRGRGRPDESASSAAKALEVLLKRRPGIYAKEACEIVMQSCGCSQSTVYRAKDKLGVTDTAGFWKLPGDQRDIFEDE